MSSTTDTPWLDQVWKDHIVRKEIGYKLARLEKSLAHNPSLTHRKGESWNDLHCRAALAKFSRAVEYLCIYAGWGRSVKYPGNVPAFMYLLFTVMLGSSSGEDVALAQMLWWIVPKCSRWGSWLGVFSVLGSPKCILRATTPTRSMRRWEVV